MITVQAAPPEHMPWLAERAGITLSHGLKALEAVDDSGRIVAMVGYDGWMPGSVQMHVALEHPAALRHVLRPGFGVVFDPKPRGFGLPLARAPVLSNNRASIELVTHLGFKQVACLKDWWAPGVDILLFDMQAHECRWLKPERKAA